MRDVPAGPPPNAEVKEDRYHRVERAYGTFQRSFLLPTQVDHEKVQATYHDGVLELRLPKLEVAKLGEYSAEGCNTTEEC